MENLEFEVLSDENVEEVHAFCEKNNRFWSQPLKFFKRASLGDSSFNENLTIIARNKQNGEIIAFFMGTTRESVILKKKINKILKFFIVDQSHRRKGIATHILQELYKRFKENGSKGSIRALTSPPDYWFTGVNPKMTPAYFWMQTNGFKHRKFHNKFRQDLFVELNKNPLIDSFENNPIHSKNGYKFIRVNEQYFDKTYEFVKKEFFGSWCEEAKMSFLNKPPTTFIAVDESSDEVVGFATFNAQFFGSFGPTGVKKTLRGKGIGGILLRWTLLEMKRLELEKCQILWVVGDTVKYYSKVAQAYICQIYFPMKGKIK